MVRRKERENKEIKKQRLCKLTETLIITPPIPSKKY